LKSLAESISRQLRAWADSLQNTKITGQRYLTDKTRQAEKSARERHEFLEKLRRIGEHKEAEPAKLEEERKE
jgi:hypothetical protein